MKVHKTLNPLAYENTYYIENDSHLILVDPGSNFQAIQKKITEIGKPIMTIS